MDDWNDENRIINEYVIEKLDVAPLVKTTKKNKPKWFKHFMWMERWLAVRTVIKTNVQRE